MEDGTGVPNVFPPIKGNTGLHADAPTSIARLVLAGAHSAKTNARPEGFAMPAFGGKLTDEEIADVLTYPRSAFGNAAPAVSADKLASVRKAIGGEH